MDPVFVEDCLSALDYKSVGSAALRRGGRRILFLEHLGVETLDWEFPIDARLFVAQGSETMRILRPPGYGTDQGG